MEQDECYEYADDIGWSITINDSLVPSLNERTIATANLLDCIATHLEEGSDLYSESDNEFVIRHLRERSFRIRKEVLTKQETQR